MAGRRSPFRDGTIELAFVVEASLRLAGAIALETLAFVIWNIGTRSPLALVRDVQRSLGSGRSLLAGVLSALVGLIFVAAATVLLLPAIVDPPAEFAPVALFTFLVALILEHLIGNDLRRLRS